MQERRVHIRHLERDVALAEKLELPRLQRIVFRFEHFGPMHHKPRLQLADLAASTKDQLSSVRLALDGVDLQGELDKFSEIFK
ncbi:hypothetical protein AURDEDRAFT_112597 [Auricularia subglabra TFB-10046 SS5]|nr:hypothetical protein AURDEDRAFT_112597 [Auricularia subglabra TFB-10046 SS5]